MLLLLPGACLTALGQMTQTDALFQSMLRDDQGGKPAATAQMFSPGIREEIAEAAPDDIHQLLPLVRKCLESKSGALRWSAIIFLAAVALRPDGADTLEPFIEPLRAVSGGGTDPGLKRGAISVIASSIPKPSPGGLAFLAAHLNDTDNTGQEFVEIGATLIKAFPNDPVLLHTVIEDLRRRSLDRFEAGRMMEVLGLLGITTEESLAFLAEGLDNPRNRQSAVEAIGRLPSEARARFLPRLQRIAEDPDESADTRSRAQRVLLER